MFVIPPGVAWRVDAASAGVGGANQMARRLKSMALDPNPTRRPPPPPVHQAFGVDDSRIPFIVGTIGAAFAFLFSSWSNKQDNDEFFSGARLFPAVSFLCCLI